MATTIKNYVDVIGAGTNLETYAANMATAFEEIQNQTNKIASGEGIFDGTAASDIKTTISSFTNQLTTFSDAVKECGAFIKSVGSAYQSASSQANAAFTSSN